MELLSCPSPAGVGENLTALVSISGILSDVFTDVRLSYEAPVINELYGPGAVGSATSGNVVFISGRNFGPASVNAVDTVTYTPVELPYRFPAECTVIEDDETLRCVTPGGVGAKLLWQVR